MLVSFGLLALPLPELGEAHGRTEFERFGLLLAAQSRWLSRKHASLPRILDRLGSEVSGTSNFSFLTLVFERELPLSRYSSASNRNALSSVHRRPRFGQRGKPFL